MKNIGRPFLITLLALVLTIMGFAYYYNQATAAIATANYTVSTLNSQVLILEGQVSSANSQISSLQTQLTASKSLAGSVQSQLTSAQSQLAAATSQVSSLQGDLTAYKSQVASLQTDIASYKSQVTSLQGDVASYQSRVTSLQGQLATVGAANVTDLQAQVSSLRAQNQELTDIVNLTRVSIISDQITVNQPASHPISVATFFANYAGYIVVGGQTSSADIFITVTDSFANYPYNDYRYQFGTGATLTIPVLPGTVTVRYNNANPNALSTGTISVRYYY